MKVLGMYYFTYLLGPHWQIIPDCNPGYRVLEVQDAFAIVNIPNDNRVEIRQGICKCDIRRKDGGPLSEEEAYNLVRDIATNELVELDQYDMALFEWEEDSVPVVNEWTGEFPLEVKIITDDNEED